MPFDLSNNLWPGISESFFRDAEFAPLRQQGPHCVSTVLGILTGTTPEFFQDIINTQDPVSWSEVLQAFGMKLAYCPTDVRKLKFYMPELEQLDDLFTLSFYSDTDPESILGDPNEYGWVTGSHIVILHRNRVIDPALGTSVSVQDHYCTECHTKRVFRVLPVDHPRGL